MDGGRGRRAAEMLAEFCARPPVPVGAPDRAAAETRALELFHRVISATKS